MPLSEGGRLPAWAAVLRSRQSGQPPSKRSYSPPRRLYAKGLTFPWCSGFGRTSSVCSRSEVCSMRNRARLTFLQPEAELRRRTGYSQLRFAKHRESNPPFSRLRCTATLWTTRTCSPWRQRRAHTTTVAWFLRHRGWALWLPASHPSSQGGGGAERARAACGCCHSPLSIFLFQVFSGDSARESRLSPVW
jgi:hypothetical protein